MINNLQEKGDFIKKKVCTVTKHSLNSNHNNKSILKI